MHGHLSFSALFLDYNPHNNVYMPSNTTFHFGEGKACSILQEFSADLSAEPGLTLEKSWRFAFSIRKNFSSSCRFVVYDILNTIRILQNSVPLPLIFGDADNSTG